MILGWLVLFHLLHLLDVHTFQMHIGQAQSLHCQLPCVDLAQNQFWWAESQSSLIALKYSITWQHISPSVCADIYVCVYDIYMSHELSSAYSSKNHQWKCTRNLYLSARVRSCKTQIQRICVEWKKCLSFYQNSMLLLKSEYIHITYYTVYLLKRQEVFYVIICHEKVIRS